MKSVVVYEPGYSKPLIYTEVDTPKVKIVRKNNCITNRRIKM